MFNLVRAALLTLLILSGCTVPVVEEGGEGEPIDTATDEILNGTVITGKFGVVDIGGCAGVMISPVHIVTAGHCVAGQLSSKSGFITATVSYFDPATAIRPISDQNELMWAWLHDDYTSGTDARNDLALIKRYHSAKGAWNGTSERDYLKLSIGSCSQIDRNTFYGRGPDGSSGAGTLRYMPVDIKWCGSGHFYDLQGSRRTCVGDSGGPNIVTLIDPTQPRREDVVVGLFSNLDTENGTGCTKSGGKQRYFRMTNGKINWLESKIGHACTVDTYVGHSFRKCF
jgi:hypothetical protein